MYREKLRFISIEVNRNRKKMKIKEKQKGNNWENKIRRQYWNFNPPTVTKLTEYIEVG